MIAVLGADMPNIQTLLTGKIDFAVQRAFETPTYLGLVNNSRVVFADLGSTKVMTATNLLNVINAYNPTVVILVGNGGGVKKPSYGSIIVNSNTMQYDMNNTALGKEMGEIPSMDLTYFPSDNNLYNLACNACALVGVSVSGGMIVSADTFLADTAQADALITSYDAVGVDEETGAVGEACFLKKTPYVSIKGVSNYADDNAANDYNAYCAQANNKALEVGIKTATLYIQSMPTGGCLC